MTSETETPKMITLTTSDDKDYLIDYKIIKRSNVIRDCIGDCDVDDMPLPIDSEMMDYIIKYCTHHVDDEIIPSDEVDTVTVQRFKHISEWDDEFTNSMTIELRFRLLMAVNYLDITDLLHLLCSVIGKKIIGKNPEEVRELYGDYMSEPVGVQMIE
ncbi:MAG: hypothetical protein N2B06_01800 [Clostridium sp.]